MSVAVAWEPEGSAELASYLDAGSALLCLLEAGPITTPLGPAASEIVAEYVAAALDYRLVSSVEGHRLSDDVTVTIGHCRELLAMKVPELAVVPEPVSTRLTPIVSEDALPADAPIHGFSRRWSARARWY